MGEFFTPLDIVVFLGSLIGAMVVGLIAGRKEDTSEDYFLAGRSIPWWGVAGSIFGTNVSANHLVGMMGIGFSVGFAQSHFELGAVFGLLTLCYLFLPVYRRLGIFTLSEYLGKRYGDSSRLLYAVIMVVIMVGVQMVPGLYIGARTICFMLGGDAVQEERLLPERLVGDDEPHVAATASGQNADVNSEASAPRTGRVETRVNMTYYVACVIGLAVIAAGYTIVGGMKAVVWTDVIQSFLLLAAGIGVAVLTFDKIGGWSGLISRDLQGAEKMHLYLPSHHPELPWTGVFTGLLAMHCFYWGTNQFIVQRALAARSDRDAQLGIVAAGFLKLLIPFFAIGTGVAAFYLFDEHRPGQTVDPDTAFPVLVQMVVPVGYGVIGLISAGLIGAILSSIDSLMNSAATIVTVDVYQRYINPEATESELLRIARITIVVFVILAALMAMIVLNPNSKQNFFLQIANYQNYLTPGILVAFVLGIVWKRGTAAA
ncbi:MAG: sodium/solute symporter, partial [Planctomycetaceae bacterium]